MCIMHIQTAPGAQNRMLLSATVHFRRTFVLGLCGKRAKLTVTHPNWRSPLRQITLPMKNKGWKSLSSWTLRQKGGKMTYRGNIFRIIGSIPQPAAHIKSPLYLQMCTNKYLQSDRIMMHVYRKGGSSVPTFLLGKP